MSTKKQKRRLYTAIMLALAILASLGTMAAATDADPAVTSASTTAKGFCTPLGDGGIQKMCGGGGPDVTGTQTGSQCKGNPVDC